MTGIGTQEIPLGRDKKVSLKSKNIVFNTKPILKLISYGIFTALNLIMLLKIPLFFLGFTLPI